VVISEFGFFHWCGQGVGPKEGARGQGGMGCEGPRNHGVIMPKVSELKAQCKALGLSTTGNKSKLVQQLAHPDLHRVMVGAVSLKITDRLTIEHLQIIKDQYLKIGHPCKEKMNEWKVKLGISTVDTEFDSHLYAIVQFLGNKKGVVNQAAFPPDSSSTPASTPSGTSASSSIGRPKKRRKKTQETSMASLPTTEN
jgi:hypothetical protein